MKVTLNNSALPAVLFSLLYLAGVRSLKYREACINPHEELGECERLSECPKFAPLLQVERVLISDRLLDFLHQSRCGKLGDYELYCCPYETKPTSTTTSSPSDKYGDSCRTPDRRQGVCIGVSQCPRFSHLIGKASKDIPPRLLNLLNKSYCGIYSDVPLVCCPSASTAIPSTSTSTSTTPATTTVRYEGICWTPNALKGKCIEPKDCPQFADALSINPVSESVQEALNQSFCGMKRKKKLVCCPDEEKVIYTTPDESLLEAIEIELGYSCKTSYGETGACMNEIDCIHQHGVSSIGHIQSASNKMSFCEMKDGKRLICCPPDSDHAKTEHRCKTPSQEDGKCISLKECPTLLSLVNSSLTKFDLDQLQKSHCGPGGSNTYCCPSPSKDNEDINDLRQHQNLVLLNQNDCGKSPISWDLKNYTEIGKKAKLSSIPWMALIDYKNGNSSQFRCVGSIINSRYILTAARCVSYLHRDIEPISVRLGEYNLDYALDCTDDICAPAPQNIYIEKTIPHPGYLGKQSYINDIAIIRLVKNINFDLGSVKPVCLPIEESLRVKDYTDKKLLVSGWFNHKDELSRELLQDVVEGISHEVCSKYYENETAISTDIHMCVQNGRQDDCLGKGASPIFSFEEFMGRTAAVQQGIGLFGADSCYLSRQPVVYTRVGKYMKWILDNIRP